MVSSCAFQSDCGFYVLFTSNVTYSMKSNPDVHVNFDTSVIVHVSLDGVG